MVRRIPELCDICEKTPEDFNSKKNYNEHFGKKDHVDTEINCSQCEKSFPNRVRLRIHEKRTHNNDHFNCNQCNKFYFLPSKRSSSFCDMLRRSEKIESIL